MSDPRTEGAARLRRLWVIAVVRAASSEEALRIGNALVAGGVRAVEVTTSTPGFDRAIRALRAAHGDAAFVGAGTLLTEAQSLAALGAGAEFLVSPVLRAGLVPLAADAGVPVLLGAYTPTECLAAHEAGADFVKLFPADTLGPAHVRALRAPMPQLALVPTGGVTPGNVGEWLRAGCAAVGAGSSLVPAELVRAGDWPALAAHAARFAAATAAA
jgi:2-dehydro-3-deoxyphosphogluconate aldolase/(4S)-4-hydroxy-2-oxoglutarate aldolase